MNELKYMYKNILKFDLYIFLAFLLISCLFFRAYIFPLLIGLIVGAANFIVSGHFIQIILCAGKRNFLIISVMVARLLLVCLIAALFLEYFNKYYLFAYLIGFVSHFIAIILYGTISMKEGK